MINKFELNNLSGKRVIYSPESVHTRVPRTKQPTHITPEHTCS